MIKYTPEVTNLQHLIFSRGSMLDLAFSPHRGLDVKKSNPLIAFGQSNFVWELVGQLLTF